MVESEDRLLKLLGYSHTQKASINARMEGEGVGYVRRTAQEHERDLAIIASLYLRGRSIQEIANEMNTGRERPITFRQVYTDLNRIRSAWIKSTLIDFNSKQARELAKLDELERAYWLAWENSLQKKETSTAESVNDTTGVKGVQAYSRKKVKKVTSESEGQVAFLMGIERCISQRCKILGLSAPQRYEINWRKEAERAGIDPDLVQDELVAQFQRYAEQGLEKKELGEKKETEG